jgi:HAE1 family hydrophobic/amphiphilic exporter-1
MRSLSDPFVRRPVLTVLLTVAAILFGIMTYRNLPVNDLPAVDYPVIQVRVSYPGASPETMANNVATPLEKQFMQISGLDMVTSRSVQGFSSLTLQFVLGKNIDAAATDVQTAISAAGGNLPPDLPSPPTFTKTNPNDQPILYIALISDSVTQAKLYDYASTNVGQRPTRAHWRCGNFPWMTWARPSATNRCTPGRGKSTAARGHFCWIQTRRSCRQAVMTT